MARETRERLSPSPSRISLKIVRPRSGDRLHQGHQGSTRHAVLSSIMGKGRVMGLVLLLAAVLVGGMLVMRGGKLLSCSSSKKLEACEEKLSEVETKCSGQQGSDRTRRELQGGGGGLGALLKEEGECSRQNAELAKCQQESQKCNEGSRQSSDEEAQRTHPHVRVKAKKNADILKMSDQEMADEIQRLRENTAKRVTTPKVVVKRGNEDILKMEEQEMADEIQRLRGRLDNSRLRVRRGNEDIIQMEDQEMVDEIQKLRKRLDNSRLRVGKGNEDLLRMEDQELVNEVQRLRLVELDKFKCQRLEEKLERIHDTDLQTKGYRCSASKADMERYLKYKAGGVCPNDWYFIQRLMFKKQCFALPRRRCRIVTPAHPQEPLPRPESFFSQRNLMDSNVRWDLHQCKSFRCLNHRTSGDCLNCFNMTLESHRWRTKFRGTIPMADVIALKNGSLRIGLDAGGGTGSFAAHMAEYGVQIMTTAFNVETVVGKYAGLPYMETIALRGLIPLHVPHQARLPFFDGTLDVVHSVNSIKYIEPPLFAELLYEWDRVLRVGGILWFEMFYNTVTQMPIYTRLIQELRYKKLYWNFTPKTDAAEEEGEHIYLNCVLEKTPNVGSEPLDGPSEEDMQDII